VNGSFHGGSVAHSPAGMKWILAIGFGAAPPGPRDQCNVPRSSRVFHLVRCERRIDFATVRPACPRFRKPTNRRPLKKSGTPSGNRRLFNGEAGVAEARVFHRHPAAEPHRHAPCGTRPEQDLQDILSRKARIDGKEVLSTPGNDHAGIATPVWPAMPSLHLSQRHKPRREIRRVAAEEQQFLPGQRLRDLAHLLALA